MSAPYDGNMNDLRALCQELISKSDMDTLTMKELRRCLEKTMGKPEKYLDEFKDTIKDLVTKLVNTTENQAPQNPTVQPATSSGKAKRKLSKTKCANKTGERRQKKKHSGETSSSFCAPTLSPGEARTIERLKMLGRAKGIGPAMYGGGLVGRPGHEQIKVLTEALQKKGVHWSGQEPSLSEISSAKAERERQQDLDGIDPSLVVEGKRSRRGGNAEWCVGPAPLSDVNAKSSHNGEDASSEEQEFEF